MKKTAVLLACLLAMGVFGCNQYRYKTTEGSYAPTQVRDPNLPGTQIRWNNVSILDASIAGKIFVEGTGTSRTATNTLAVWSVFRNRTDYPLQLEVRTTFYDHGQAPLEGPTAWQRLILPPNSAMHYKEYSTRVDVGYYHIEAREGR